MILAGAFLGALIFMNLQDYLQIVLLSGYPHEKLTWDIVLRLPYWLTALILFLVIIIALKLLESYRKWHDDLGPNYDGLK